MCTCIIHNVSVWEKSFMYYRYESMSQIQILFLISKIYPLHAGPGDIVTICAVRVLLLITQDSHLFFCKPCNQHQQGEHVSCFLFYVKCFMFDISGFMFDISCFVFCLSCFIFNNWSFIFYVLCFIFYVLRFMFYVLRFAFYILHLPKGPTYFLSNVLPWNY